MIINAISGFSASSRKQSDTLAGFLDEVFGASTRTPWPGGPHFAYSASRHCINDSLSHINHFAGHPNTSDSLLLIGKSLGAVRTWWLAYNHWDEIKHFKKIRIILIDPHGWQRGDGRWGSYGRKMFNGKWRNLRLNDEWFEHPDFKIINLFQRKEFPRGADLGKDSKYPNGSDLRWLSRFNTGDIGSFAMPPGANHWNCTDIMTDTGEFVAGVIREVVEGLE